MINEKLRELRLSRGLTQDEVAEYLGVSSQSVSKWERGLQSPDIKLLPMLAVLYRTSIDSLFNMESFWDEKHKNDFLSRTLELSKKGDQKGVFSAYVSEIEMMPDHFEYYVNIMLFVLRCKMFEDQYIRRLIKFTDYADLHCNDDDIRNEIHRLMLQICSSSENSEYRDKGKKYYLQLSKLRHSREIYARFVMDGNEYREQLKRNIMYCVDVAECAIRQMIRSEMSAEEKLFYYKKAAGLYETVTDCRYAGVYNTALLCNYAQIALLLTNLENNYEAQIYTEKLIAGLEQIADGKFKSDPSPFSPIDHSDKMMSPERQCAMLIRDIIDREAFKAHREKLISLMERMLKN